MVGCVKYYTATGMKNRVMFNNAPYRTVKMMKKLGCHFIKFTLFYVLQNYLRKNLCMTINK